MPVGLPYLVLAAQVPSKSHDVYCTKCKYVPTEEDDGPEEIEGSPRKVLKCAVLKWTRALWCSSVLCGALQCSSVLCGALRGSAVFRGVLRCSYTVNAFHEVFHLHALSVLRKMVMTVLLHWKFSTTQPHRITSSQNPGLLVHGVHRTHVCAPWMIINSGAFFTAMATRNSLAPL